jgi:hypothetical protein
LREKRRRKAERGEEEREMLSSAVKREREPKRWINPREPTLRPELIPQGAKKERSYRAGSKSSKRRFNTEKGLKESAGTKGERGRPFFRFAGGEKL